MSGPVKDASTSHISNQGEKSLQKEASGNAIPFRASRKTVVAGLVCVLLIGLAIGIPLAISGSGAGSSAAPSPTTPTGVVCPPHSSSPPTSDVIGDCVCNDGYTGPNGGTCVACEPGKYSVQGDLTCSGCEAGKYSDVSGATTADLCQTCPAGFFCPVGSSDKQLCAAGTYSSSSAGVCAQCPAGKHSPYMGTSAPDSQIQVGSFVILQDGYEDIEDALQGPLQPGDVGTVVEMGNGVNGLSSRAGRLLTSSSLAVLVTVVCELLTTTPAHGGAGYGTRPLFALLLASYFQLGSQSTIKYKVRAPDRSTWWYEKESITLFFCSSCEPGKYKDSPGPGACTSCPDNTVSPAGLRGLFV